MSVNAGRLLRFAFAFWVIGYAAPSRADEPIWDANKVEMIREQLAPGVYAFYARDAKALNASGGAAANSGGLIVGSRGAMLIETMLDKRLFGQVQALVRGVSQVPLAYAVNTSFHGDHSYGNMYLPRQTRIVQHEFTRSYVDQHLAEDKAFMIQHFGTGRGIEAIRARTRRHPRQGRAVDHHRPGRQAGSDHRLRLCADRRRPVRLGPESRVMWTGNPVIAAKPSLPWLLNGHLVETLATLQKVYAFLPADARVVPGHGVAITREDLHWHIDYLAAVKSGVQEAVDGGLTLEQTVQKVKLPEFSGYVLFGWGSPVAQRAGRIQGPGRKIVPGPTIAGIGPAYRCSRVNHPDRSAFP